MTAKAIIPEQLEQAVRQLQAGGVIAYPTEGVWGYGCDPENPEAVGRLLQLKQRPLAKGLILVAATVDQFSPYLEGLDAALVERFSQPTSHPTTWLVPHNGTAGDWIRGDFNNVALRVSAHPVVVALCQAFAGPIVSTSANIAGQPSALDPSQLRGFLGKGLDCIVPGDLLQAGRPSEIRDLVTGKVLRPA